MNLIYLYMIIFLGMLSLPVGIALMYHIKKPAKPMYINQDKKRDPRFFANRFSEKIESAKIDKNKRTIKIDDKVEKFINVDTCNRYQNIIEKSVLAFNKDFIVPSNVKEFKNAIYAKNDIVVNHSGVSCNMMLAKKDIYLNGKVQVAEWIDAGNRLFVTDGCNLGTSASSKHEIHLNGEVEFRRLYAPAIYCGENLQDRSYPFNQIKKKEDTVSKSSITISGNTKFIGDLRSYKDIVIEDNTMMKGNVFADGNITIGENCIIYGTVFSQESITIGKGSIVGEKGEIRSIIARESVVLNENCIVYGYISCEKGGYKKG